MNASALRTPQGSHLLAERPLVIIPSLAVLLGLNEAIVLQQLHYWVGPRYGLSTNIIDDAKWAYNSYQEWQKQFPWWSIPTIQRTFTALERRGIVIARTFEAKNWDHKKWYTIDYDAYNALLASNETSSQIDDTIDTIEHITLESSVHQDATPDHINMESSTTHTASCEHINQESSTTSHRKLLNGTKTTPEINAKNDVVVALMTLGLTKRQARAAVAQHALTLAEVAQWESWLATLDTTKTRPIAVFVAAIKEKRLPVVTRPAAPQAALGWIEQVPERRPAPHTILVPHVATAPVAIPLSDLWSATLSQLHPQLPHNDWETWLKPTVLLDIHEGEAVVGTPNVFVRQEVEQRYADLLQGALQGALGRPMQIHVVIVGIASTGDGMRGCA